MKLHKITKIILIFAVVAVLAAGQTMAQAYPTEKVSGGYTVGGTNYDLIKGTCSRHMFSKTEIRQLRTLPQDFITRTDFLTLTRIIIILILQRSQCA